MTERLHLQDSWLRHFEATVIAHAQWGGRPSLLLDASAFYPESGGQMADHGRLVIIDDAASAAGQLRAGQVVDVQLDDKGVVHHVLDGPLPPVGSRVAGDVDAPRRRVHMAQHTGQHVLSRALVDIAGAQTISSRLGETACTIDTDSRKLSEEQLARVEGLANAVIDDDLEVQVRYPDAGELSKMALRRPSKVEQDVRVVKIGDFDVTPCGGTHCTRSAQIGLLHITQVERHKGGLRITFVAGARARTRLSVDSRVAGGLAKELSCAIVDLPAALAKLSGQATTARRGQTAARERLAHELAKRFAADAEAGVWVCAFADIDAEVMRRLASQLCGEPGRALALAVHAPEGVQVVVARSSDRELECGKLLRHIAKASDGRGGGRPERAEGKLPAGVDWSSLVAAALAGAASG